MDRRTRRLAPALGAAALLIVLSGCSRTPPAKQYHLEGQILAIRMDRQQLTIKHGDIGDYMPAMTMSFPVASPSLLTGRTVGELVSATLQVQGLDVRLVEVQHKGTAPLPDESNVATLAGGVLEVGDAVPDAALIDQTDKRRSLADWAGTATLVTFIYTRCPLPDFCPLMDQNFATLQRAVAKDDTLRGRVKLISISFDPEHDTPSVLKAHGAKLKADPDVWTFLTGDRVTVDRVAGSFGVSVIREGSPASITHNLRTTLVGPDRKVVKIYTGNEWTPGAVLADVRALVSHR